MINCNPETVSTDYDTSDRLYFEPLTLENVLAVVEREKPQGVIVQFGGQTPLNLALDLKRNGVPIIGTAPESIDSPKTGKRFGGCSIAWSFRSRATEPRWFPKKPRASPKKSACRCWCAPATCSADAPW
jgi:hypothetical protein